MAQKYEVKIIEILSRDHKSTDFSPYKKKENKLRKFKEDKQMNKTADNEVMKNMEFLIKELHREWDRSGANKGTVVIGTRGASKVNEMIGEKIAIQQEDLDGEDITLKELMNLTRENYVLLRMARKIKDNQDQVNQKEIDYEFSVSFDKEELQLFKEMFEPKLN